MTFLFIITLTLIPMRNDFIQTILSGRTASRFALTVLFVFSVLIVSMQGVYANDVLQEKQQVTGKVIDGTTNDPLPGVSILIKGTTTGTITDMDGNFSLDVEPSDVLVFSFIGYLSEEIPVGNSTEINVTLVEDIIGLDEVVVTGYGVQKKSDLTGAIASVSGDKLAKVPVAGVDQALQGRAAGVQVSSQTGAPGSDIVIRIRGISSINGGDPVVIIDGVPSSMYAMSALNPNDIQSVEVLKDASSQAIYGASGGNGVVLITTKKGQEGKIKAELDYYYGFQNPHERIDMMNTAQFIETYNQLEDVVPWPEDTAQYLPDVNWQDEVFRNAPIHNINFAVSGGNESSTYRFSTSYYFQEGVIPNSKYNRLTLRLNSNHRLSKIFSVGQNLTLSNENYSGFQTWQYNHAYESPVVQAYQMHPMITPYDTAGNWNTSPFSNIDNPYVIIDVTDRDVPEYRAMGDISLSADIIKGLTYKTILGGNIDFGHSREFTKAYFYNSSNNNDDPFIRRDHHRNWGWSWQHTLTYDFSVGGLNVKLMGGYEATYYLNEGVTGTRYDLMGEQREMHYFGASLDAGEFILTSLDNDQEVATDAYFGRINLDYKGRYLLTTNLRRDQNSKFGPDQRVGFFPSVSVGWKFSEEGFMKNQDVLSFGKLRAGWGRIGNSNFDPYVYYARVSAENVYGYPITNNNTAFETGASPVGIVNYAIHWEEMEDYNIGLDLSFWNNRISLSGDYFSKNNIGMIIEVPTPDMAGTYQQSPGNEGGPSVYVGNLGNVTNKGFEITAGFKGNTGDIKHNFDFNFTYVENEVGDIGGDTLFTGSSYTFTSMLFTAEGYPMGSLYGYQTDGLFGYDDCLRDENGDLVLDSRGSYIVVNQPTYVDDEGITQYAQPRAQPGDIRFVDVDGDGNITTDDRTILGNPNPKYLIGFSYDLEWKGIDFSMFWQGAFGHQNFLVNKVWMYNTNGRYNWCVDALNAWSDDNQDATLYRLNPYDENENVRLSDFYVEDAGYLRLKNIQIGYTLPREWTEKVGIEKFRAYIGARDLLTITKYPGLDPEIYTDRYDPLTNGIDVSTYPRPRVFIFGFNVIF